MAPDEPGVWVFNGNRGCFPAGVFTTLETADRWIAKRKLSGILTWYPLDINIYDWAIENDYWQPKYADHETAEFIERFHSAGTDHHHYTDGYRHGHAPQDDTETVN